MFKQKILISALATFVVIFGTLLLTQKVSAATVDLQTYYPNTQLFNNYYLEGTNNADVNNPVRSVLWFSKENDNGPVFKQYNSAPEDSAKDCHWDLLSWANDILTYNQTHDGCSGHNKSVTFSSPIQYLPRYWDDSASWTTSGTTNITTTKLDGSTGCTGTTAWTATILGYETINNTNTIHWKTQQTTNWATGSDSPYCVAASTLHWQEDYYLSNSVAVTSYGGLASAPGLYRSVGGNLDGFQQSGLHDWDITMSHWQLLPWASPLSIPGVPATGEKSQRSIVYVAVALILPAFLLAYFIQKRLQKNRS